MFTARLQIVYEYTVTTVNMCLYYTAHVIHTENFKGKEQKVKILQQSQFERNSYGLCQFLRKTRFRCKKLEVCRATVQ